MTTEKLNAAIQLIQSGNRQAAVPVLRELIQENTRNESAWLWLSACMDEVEHKKFCLQSVLTINPANQQARDMLTSLTAPVPEPAPDPDPEPELASWVKPKPVKLDELSWDVATPNETDSQQPEPEEIAWKKAEPKREKMAWEQVDFAEPDDVFWRKAEPERSPLEKMEWELGKDSATTQPPPTTIWDKWDEAEPVAVRQQKTKVVKAPSKQAARRQSRSRNRPFFSIFAGVILFLMLVTVSFVFLMQVLAVTP